MGDWDKIGSNLKRNNLKRLLSIDMGAVKRTVDWCIQFFVDFNAGRMQLISFNHSDNSGNTY